MSPLLHRCRVPRPSEYFRIGFLLITLLTIGVINLNRLPIMATTLRQAFEGTPQMSHFTCDSCNAQSFTFPIANEDFCAREPPFLFIIVLSHVKNAERRKVIRNSWGSIKQHRNLPVKVLYVLGTIDYGIPHATVRESHKHQDVLVVYIKEHNTEITLKMMAALQWILDFCPSAKFILKTNDHSYSNPGLFVDFLLNTWGLPKHFIAGRCTLFRPNRDFYSKDYTSYETYANLYFPTYCSGQAYIMPSRTLKQIYETSTNIINFHLEDVFITGFCRSAANVRYIQIPGVLSSGHEWSMCNMNKALNVQGISSDQVQQTWNSANEYMKLINSTNCSYIHISFAYKYLFVANVLFIACSLSFVRIFKLKLERKVHKSDDV